MSLFSKLKDYNAELDNVLDNKYFSSNIKNLLLNLVYKLEISYRDFEVVKRCVRSKEDFLNEIIETIRLYCDNVKTVEPDSNQAKMLIRHKVRALTNEKERSILAYPTELALLYAISDISPKYFYIDEEFLIKSRFQTALVNGYNYNNIEILKDFSGWSWDRTYDENFDYIDNLIYYNLLAILGEKFLYEWRTYGSTRRNFIEEAEEYAKYFSNDNLYFRSLYKLLYISAQDKPQIDEQLKDYAKELKKMENRAKYFENAKVQKEKLENKLKKINLLLTDDKLLKKQVEKLNAKNEKKVRASSYKKLLLSERVKITKEIEKIAFLLKPTNFMSYKQKLKTTIEIYSEAKDFEEVLVECQKNFLEIMYKRLCKMEKTEDIITVIYELRYYRKLKVSKDIVIEDFEELEIMFDKVLKKAVTMLCKSGAMKILSMDVNLNFEIIKYILDTKIIKLEQIKVAFAIDVEGIIIKVYDKDIFEKQGRKKIDIRKASLEVKTGHKIKLFS